MKKYFIFWKQEIVIKRDGDNIEIPNSANIKGCEFIDIGDIDQIQCLSCILENKINLPENYEYVRIRNLYNAIDEKSFWLAGKVFHLTNWEMSSKYCGKCGALTKRSDKERALTCPNCSYIIYPRISPAIIIAIIKDNKILLGRSARFPGNMYSVLAGFADIGESLEQCAEREVFEETGIRIENIKYFGSQAWPFPDSLMIAYTAEYKSGEIKIDNLELSDAKWFGADELPEIPGHLSIARELIDNFLHNL